MNFSRVASSRVRAAAVLFILSLAHGTAWCSRPPPLRISTFRCDVTPWLGEPLVWTTNLLSIEEPLLAKGIILKGGSERYVICAIDWCLLANESEWSFRKALAAAAGTDAAHVAIHCVHQHAAPYADEEAHHLIESAPSPPSHLSSAFLEDVRARLAGSVAESARHLKPFDSIGAGQGRVERVASARRLRDEKGHVVVRYSTSGKDPKMAQAPEGLIDPFLKTITLAGHGHPIVRLHYYASHPQTFCCDGRASADFISLAREEIEQREGVFQIYFTGCGGDVTVGKYNDGSRRSLAELTERLQAGMQASIRATRFQPAKKLLWRERSVVLPLRAAEELTLSQSRGWLGNPSQSDTLRVYEGAMRLSFAQRINRPLDLSSLQIGSVYLLHLPGEPMLEFQFFAQRTRPRDFVAVAGYGDCGPAYICTDRALEEGGYEPSATNVGKGSEARLKEAIQWLLGGEAVN